jgi:hypothetical protein
LVITNITNNATGLIGGTVYKRPSTYRTFQTILCSWITKLTRCTLKTIALHLMFFIIFTSIRNKVTSRTKLALWRVLLIGIRSSGASGAGGFSGVGVGTDGAVGALRGERETGLSGKGTGGATFALGVGGESEFVGVGAGGAGFAGGLERLVGEASGGTLFAGTVILESAGGAATGGGGGVAVHAGGGGGVADVGTADAGGGVGGGAIGDVAGGDPGGIGGGLAFVFGEVTDEAGVWGAW